MIPLCETGFVLETELREGLLQPFERLPRTLFVRNKAGVLGLLRGTYVQPFKTSSILSPSGSYWHYR